MNRGMPFPPPPHTPPPPHLRRWLSVFSFCAITAVVALVVIGGPIYADEERATPGHDPELDASVVGWNWPGSVAKLGSIVFALSCAPAVLHAYTSMAPRSTRCGFVFVTHLFAAERLPLFSSLFIVH